MIRTAGLVLVVLGTVASAAPKVVDPVAEATNAMAEADFDKALVLIDRALVMGGTPAELARLQLMRGETLVALRRLDEARRAFTAALAANPSADLDRNFASPDAVSTLREVRQQLSSDLTVVISSGGTAEVTLDNHPLGPAPIKTRVAAGKHRLEAVAANGQRVTKEIEVLSAQPLTVALELPSAVAAPPELTVTESSPSPESRRPTAALVPIGVGVVALGVGVALLVDSGTKYESLKKALADGSAGSDFPQQVAAGRSEQTIGLVVGSIGVAAAVGGALWYLLGSTTQTVAVYGSPNGAGISASWELP